MPKPILRIYNFSDAELKQKADSVVISMTREAAEFATRGVTAPMTTSFGTLSDNFGRMDTDEQWIGNVTAATQAKDALAESLKSKIRVIRNMAEIKWTNKGGKYRAYGFENMDGLSDDKLVRLGRRVITVATDQQADLASEGFVAGTITALTTSVNDFDTAVDTKNNTEKDRDIAQQARVEAGNVLYGFLDKYCSIGKTFNADDPARYNDYVIYPSGGGPVDPVDPTPPA